MSNPNMWAQMRSFWQAGGFLFPNPQNIVGRVWYVDGQQGSDVGGTGRAPRASAYATMAKAFTMIDSFDTIILAGVIREQIVAPLGVFDVSIIGGANTPRQATSGGVPTGGGSTWLAPTSPTASTPLLELIEQGWNISNIFFGAVNSTPSIKLTRAEDAVHPDPSHAVIQGCVFQPGAATGSIGIEDSGGIFHCSYLNNIFYGLTTAIKGISGAGIATPSLNRIEGNWFRDCVNAIDWALGSSVIRDNILENTTTLKINLTGGGGNCQVLENFLGVAHASYSIAGGFTDSGATDIWRNYTSDTAAAEVALPA